MRLPNKITAYDESILAVFPVLLESLKKKDQSPSELFAVCKSIPISEFIEALDCLYALGKIELDGDGGLLHYVG